VSCVNLPLIVAKGSYLNQSGDIAKTTIYNVVNEGLYRISGSVRQTSGNGTVISTAYWTDEVGPESAAMLQSQSVAPSVSGSVTIFCVASSKIELSIAVGFPPLEYNFRYIIEAL